MVTTTARKLDENPVPGPEDLTEPTEPITIKLDEDPDEAVTIALDAPESRARVEPKPDDAEDALAKAVAAAKRAEELARNAQRERDAAIQQTRQRDVELRRERDDREDAQYNSVLTAIAAETSSMQKARSDYAQASAAGDWETAGNAQQALAVASARLDRLEDGKRAFETKRETAQQQQQPPPRPQPQPQQQPNMEAVVAQLPPVARDWLKTHPEFMNEPVRTQKLNAVHQYLVDQKGVGAFSPAYFEALDTEFGFRQPEPQQRSTQRRSIPVAAPVSRDVPSSTSGTRTQSDMTLSAEERLIARNSFGSVKGAKDLSNEEKEYLYAQNKRKYHKMLASGQYRDARHDR